MAVEKCPVCSGKGVVPSDFYPDTKGSTQEYVMCRACFGRGVIIVA